MNKLFLTVFFIAALFFVSCTNDKSNDLEIQIKKTEKQLFETQAGSVNKQDAANIIHLYLSFVDQYPENEKSAEYLFKAADVSINTFHSQQTIQLFNQLLQDYPQFEKAPQALFLKAFAYENYLMQLDSAKANYQLFLAKYPEHTFAKDAQVSLDNLGKSPEEIIQSFKNR